MYSGRVPDTGATALYVDGASVASVKAGDDALIDTLLALNNVATGPAQRNAIGETLLRMHQNGDRTFDTTISSASLLFLLTTNKQLVLQLGSTIMTSRNEWQLIGDWRFLLFNQQTYGLGTGPQAMSATAVRQDFDKATQVEYSIQSISSSDLVITKDNNDKVVIEFAWDKEIELFGPVYLMIKYRGKSR